MTVRVSKPLLHSRVGQGSRMLLRGPYPLRECDGSPTRTVAYDIFYDECSYQAPCTAECASGRLSHLRLEGYVVVFALSVLVGLNLQVSCKGTNGKYG